MTGTEPPRSLSSVLPCVKQSGIMPDFQETARHQLFHNFALTIGFNPVSIEVLVAELKHRWEH